VRLKLCVVVAAFLMITPLLAEAEGLKVGFRNTVKADPALQAFIAGLKGLDTAPKTLDYKTIDGLFAPHVKAFFKSLDPFQPWRRIDDLSADYLRGAADIMVEQGEFQDGVPQPDYRPDALKIIIGQVSSGAPFGHLKEAPGAVCAPANYKVDRKAALAFAGKFDLDAYSLRFYDKDVMLEKKPDSDRARTRIPAWTLMMFDFDPRSPRGWGFYQTSDGTRGFMKDRDDTLGLAQHHVCFGKINGEYRIVALFGYGL
jgi:hypothetical protein